MSTIISHPPTKPGTKSWIWWAILNAGLLVIPFWVADFLPLTDLPQHVAQAKMLLEALSDGADSPYTIQWLTPYSLAYVVMLIAWKIGTPMLTGKIAFSIVMMLNVLTLHWFVRNSKGTSATAVLGSLFFYSAVLYWGFFQFFFGFFIFLIWLHIIEWRPEKQWTQFPLILSVSTALYFSHILWCAAGCTVLLIYDISKRLPMKTVLLRWSMLIPVSVFFLIWYPQLLESSFNSATRWSTFPWERLFKIRQWPDLFLGGLTGYWETCVFVSAMVWGGLSIWQRRSLPPRKPVLYAAVLFLVLCTSLPYLYQNTILFHQRWAPFSMILLLAAIPESVQRTSILKMKQAAVWGLAILHTALTSAAWIAFDTRDMDGMEEVLRDVPDNVRVIGLSYIYKSDLFDHYPFIQSFAYCQVVHGDTLNFSFADFKPSLVVYREPRFQRNPDYKPDLSTEGGGAPFMGWQSGLEWSPFRFTPRDAWFFDYAVVHGDDELHAFFQRSPFLEHMGGSEVWQLYRVRHSAYKKSMIPEKKHAI